VFSPISPIARLAISTVSCRRFWRRSWHEVFSFFLFIHLVARCFENAVSNHLRNLEYSSSLDRRERRVSRQHEHTQVERVAYAVVCRMNSPLENAAQIFLMHAFPITFKTQRVRLKDTIGPAVSEELTWYRYRDSGKLFVPFRVVLGNVLQQESFWAKKCTRTEETDNEFAKKSGVPILTLVTHSSTFKGPTCDTQSIKLKEHIYCYLITCT